MFNLHLPSLCLGSIIGAMMFIFLSASASYLLYQYARRTAQPGNSIVIDGTLQDGEPEQ